MKLRKFVAPLLLLVAAGPLQAAGLPSAPIFGLWRNPAGTVSIETSSCGASLCGKIVWAGPDAVKTARQFGIGQLLGTELLRGYRQTSAHSWQGEVFLPRLNRWLSSRMEQVGPDKLKISGCILGEMLCRSQTWTRT